MRNWLGSLLMAALGGVLLFAAWHGHRSGEVRAGLSGFRPYRPSREGNPTGFYFYVALYFAMGAVCVVWGILALLGLARPIPLR